MEETGGGEGLRGLWKKPSEAESEGWNIDPYELLPN